MTDTTNPQPDANGWYTIDSAPRKTVMVYDAKKGIIAAALPYGAGDSRATYGYYNNVAYDCTHWKPLGPPPVGVE
jgi:hypothetical protein